jgi:hypothetical protein
VGRGYLLTESSIEKFNLIGMQISASGQVNQKVTSQVWAPFSHSPVRDEFLHSETYQPYNFGASISETNQNNISHC